MERASLPSRYGPLKSDSDKHDRRVVLKLKTVRCLFLIHEPKSYR